MKKTDCKIIQHCFFYDLGIDVSLQQCKDFWVKYSKTKGCDWLELPSKNELILILDNLFLL